MKTYHNKYYVERQNMDTFKSGDIVNIKDCSRNLMVQPDGSLKTSYDPKRKGTDFIVIAAEVEGLPAHNIFSKEFDHDNNIIIKGKNSGDIIFTHSRFLNHIPSSVCPCCGQKKPDRYERKVNIK